MSWTIKSVSSAETITNIIDGKEVPAHITNEDTLYTKDNVVVELGF